MSRHIEVGPFYVDHISFHTFLALLTLWPCRSAAAEALQKEAEAAAAEAGAISQKSARYSIYCTR